MTDETLRKANELKKEISDLEKFIEYATKCWSRLYFVQKLMKKRKIKHRGYGCFSDGEYQLSKGLSEKILSVMEQHLGEIKEKYEKMGSEEE